MNKQFHIFQELDCDIDEMYVQPTDAAEITGDDSAEDDEGSLIICIILSYGHCEN